jgi:DeoR/GlpR family transcriptional regulator of sugar metabolism
MLQADRLAEVKRILQLQGEMSLEEMMKLFGVSRDTARRDAVKLSEDGDVLRVKRGVALRSPRSYRDRPATPAKEAIAKTACALIQDYDTLIFDTSTTIELVARLMGNRPVSVITNSIDVMNVLSEYRDVELYVTGGKLHAYHRNFVGPGAAEEMQKYSANKLFIGACAITTKGLTSPDEQEAHVKKSMIQAAQQVIVVTEHTKFEKAFLHNVCSLKEIDIIITDKVPSEEILEHLQGIQLLIAKGDGDYEEY